MLKGTHFAISLSKKDTYMKYFVICGLLVTNLNLVFANSDCQKLKLIETSRVKTTLHNTSHDSFGKNDEIRMELFSSTKKLDEKKLFSDFFGIVIYKQGPVDRLAVIQEKIQFNSKTTFSDVVVNHSSLYNKFLNIVMIDRDLQFPVASGSIEIPFVLLTGGNHDDLIFSRSIPLNLSQNSNIDFVLHNNSGDELEVSISPERVNVIDKEVLAVEFQKLNEELVNKKNYLSTAKLNLIDHVKIEKNIRELEAKLVYYQDLLTGKIKDSCIN